MSTGVSSLSTGVSSVSTGVSLSTGVSSLSTGLSTTEQQRDQPVNLDLDRAEQRQHWLSS